jgi:hypothetical protein
VGVTKNKKSYPCILRFFFGNNINYCVKNGKERKPVYRIMFVLKNASILELKLNEVSPAIWLISPFR